MMIAANLFPNLLIPGLITTFTLSPIAVFLFFWFGSEFNKALDQEQEAKRK